MGDTDLAAVEYELRRQRGWNMRQIELIDDAIRALKEVIQDQSGRRNEDGSE